MGSREVAEFRSCLAKERDVAASTQDQALSALLFLYREVLGIQLPWLDGVVPRQVSAAAPRCPGP